MTDEQQTEQTQGIPTRDDLIAAVREAGGTEAVDVQAEEQASAERAAAGEQPAAEGQSAPQQAEPQTEEEEPRIAAILRAREKARAEQEAARNHAQEMLKQAQQEAERVIQEARERAQREAEAERERLRAEFRSSPTATLRALGDPQQIVDAVVKEGSPEWRELQAIRRDLEATKAQAAVGEEARKQLAELRAEEQQRQQQAEVERVKSAFLGQHATKDAAPHLHARYDADEIFERANGLAVSWRESGLRLVPVGAPKGETDFDYDDVVKYLESDSRKRLSSVLKSSPAQQVRAGAPSGEPGIAPKVSANGPRTLSAAQGSERRTSPKPITEMTPEEARATLIDEVAAARRSNPDAVF